MVGGCLGGGEGGGVAKKGGEKDTVEPDTLDFSNVPSLT